MKNIEFGNSKVFFDDTVSESFKSHLSPFTRGKKMLLLCDDTLSALYLEKMLPFFISTTQSVVTFVLPSGEHSKNLRTCEQLYTTLSENNFTRYDCICAMGGGVVLDIGCFVASTYARGIDFVSIPTTLLAQVDSAYGGKCGVNFCGAKNIVGSIYEPKAIFVFTSFLNTLPQKIISDGLCEVIKYGFIYDFDILREIDLCVSANDFTQVVYKSILAKNCFVRGDIHDYGKRMFLNFGHTIGHALEQHSGYDLSHGNAVAIGMLYALKISETLGLCSPSLFDCLKNILNRLNISYNYPFIFDEIRDIIIKDKKTSNTGLNMILLRDYGQPEMKNISLPELEHILSDIKL